MIRAFLLLALILSGCGAVRGGTLTSVAVEVTTPASVDVNAPVVKVSIPELGEVQAPAGSTVRVTSNEVVQPDNPAAAATLTTKESDANTGTAQILSQSLAQLGWLPLIGSVVLLLGAAAFAMAFKYPIIPKAAGPVVSLSGLALIAAPTFLERYSWILAIVALITIGIGIWYTLRRLGLLQKVADQGVDGVQRFKKKHPELKDALNDSMQQAQDTDVQKAVQSRKKVLP